MKDLMLILFGVWLGCFICVVNNKQEPDLDKIQKAIDIKTSLYRFEQNNKMQYEIKQLDSIIRNFPQKS